MEQKHLATARRAMLGLRLTGVQALLHNYLRSHPEHDQGDLRVFEASERLARIIIELGEETP